jgi:hypothetical protein
MSTHQTDSSKTLNASELEIFQSQLGAFLNQQVPIACSMTYHEREDENWPRCLDINGSEQYGFDALNDDEIFDHGVTEGKILTARSVIDTLDGVFENLHTYTLDSLYQVICDTLNHYVPFAKSTTHNEKLAALEAENNDHGFDGDSEILHMVKHQIFSLGVAQGTTLISRTIIDNLEPIFNQLETLQSNITTEKKSSSFKP